MLLTAIGTTAYDGAKEGPLFNGMIGDLQDAFTGVGLSKGFGLELAFIVGLALALAAVTAIWTTGVLGMPCHEVRLSRVELGRRFAHTLIPIAAASLVADYFSLLAYNGQGLCSLASDPLGDRSLVLGHVAALVLAHDRALVVYGSHREAIGSQIVMLVVMVVFTVLGVALLSEALKT